MGDFLYEPAVAATVVTGPLGSRPQPLPYVLYAEASNTCAPAVGTATLLLFDPDGYWSDTIRPDDILTIAFSSRQYPHPAAMPAPSWTGLVDTCLALRDPLGSDGPITAITASTFWKLFTATAVPLPWFWNGQYVLPGVKLQTLLDTACQQVLLDKHIAITKNYQPLVLQPATSPLTVPNQFLDPATQNWASFLLATVIPQGVEVFFDEAGVLVARQPQFMQNLASRVIPDEEVLKDQAGVSDQGLITNVVVAYTPTPKSAFAMESPRGGIAARNSGTLPGVLTGPDGHPLPRLGQRFQSLSVPWINDPDQAGYFAAIARLIGTAQVDQADPQLVLAGDLRVGTVVSRPGAGGGGKRYYLTTYTHRYAAGQEADSQVTLRYGMPLGQPWQLASDLSWGPVTPANYPGGPPSTGTLPQPGGQGGDLSILLTTPTLSVPDIAAILAGRGSPFYQQAAYILTEASQYGIDPSFALAVWTQETGLGTDNSQGSQQHNPGNLGPFNAYPDWQHGIDAWYAQLAIYVGLGLATVNTVAARYIPDTPANPYQMETWQASVAGLMLQYRASATVVGPPGGPTVTVSGARAVIVAAAQSPSVLGTAYIWGGEQPGVGFDCSGLTQYCYAQAGITLPRTAQQQHDTCNAVSSDTILPGDLLFFANTYPAADYITHVAIALGGGQMINAENPSVGVIQDSATSDFWAAHYAGAGRPAALGSS